MSGPRIGELFAGYGGLGLGVKAAIGGDVAWVSDVCKFAKDGTAGHAEPHRSPCSILAHRYPDVPNLGDITSVDWSQVEPVDVLTGGSPCQDLSHAGKRAGMTDGTRSNLWVAMREAIAQLRPGLVVWENVRGAYSACADSDLGRCPRCVDPAYTGGHTPVLRALGRVLGDLSDLGYVGGWYGLRAADVGAPHGRMRVFVVAIDECLASDPKRGGRDWWAQDTLWQSIRRVAPAGSGDVALLPTPAVNDMGAAYTPDEWDAWTDRMKAEHGNGNGHGKSLSVEAARLLATPRAFGSRTSRHAASTAYRRSAPSLEQQVEIADGTTPREVEGVDDLQDAWSASWGDYAAAIARWEALTRPAPAPTMTSTKGNPQLAPAFVEWMMGLPAGWVTDVPGITRNEALKALGNGVVPQQAEAALRFLLAQTSVAA